MTCEENKFSLEKYNLAYHSHKLYIRLSIQYHVPTEINSHRLKFILLYKRKKSFTKSKANLCLIELVSQGPKSEMKLLFLKEKY